MTARRRVSVGFGATIIASGCVAPYDVPSLTQRAASVIIYTAGTAVPPECQEVGSVSVVDGNIESSKGYMYQGTRDRALTRLRNQAAAKGGNGVVIDDEGDVVIVDGPEVGKYYMNGRALQCPVAVRPNSALSPSHSAVTALAQGGKRRAAGRAG